MDEREPGARVFQHKRAGKAQGTLATKQEVPSQSEQDGRGEGRPDTGPSRESLGGFPSAEHQMYNVTNQKHAVQAMLVMGVLVPKCSFLASPET